MSSEQTYELPDPVNSGEMVDVSKEQFQASQPGVKYYNPLFYQMNRYRYGDPRGKSIGSKLRKFILAGDKSILGDIADAGPLAGGLAYGIPAGLLGMGIGALKDKITGTYGTGNRLGAVAALAGLGLGGYSGWLRRHTANESFKKAGSYRMGDSSMREVLLDKIRMDPSADMRIKAELMKQVQQMSEMQAQQLLNLAMSFGGGAIVAFLARKLLGTGLAGSALSGLAAGSFINALNQPKDAFGQPSRAGLDFYGNPL